MKRGDDEHQETLHGLKKGSADRAVIWVDDGSGRIVDELAIETRIRPGTEGCQLCRDPLDGTEKHGRVDFDRQGLPRFILGPGEGICGECVEWIGWLHHYAEIGPVSEPRFTEDGLVLRAGTEELYQVVEAKLTGLAAVGVWFPVYTCRRVEIGESTGEIVPACLGLEFELADFELQPLPPRYPITPSPTVRDESIRAAVDLVGVRPNVSMIEQAASRGRPLRIAAPPRPLLPGKGGGA